MKIIARLFIIILLSGLAHAPVMADPVTTAPTGAEQPGDMAIGNHDAPITIIEYASLSCPHCAAWAGNEFPVLQKEYVDTGKVRFIYRQFPTSPEKLAIAGEAIARCKGDTKSYFDLVKALYASQPLWEMSRNPGAIMRQVASSHGITEGEFDKCVSNPKISQRIQADTEIAQKTWGIAGTPSFVINGKYYPRIHAVADFRKILDPLLGTATKAEQP